MPKMTRGGVVATLLGALMLFGLSLVFVGCTGEQGLAGPAGPAGPQGPPGEPGEDPTVACIDCHNETGLITSKRLQYSYSVHGTSAPESDTQTVYDYAGARDNCTACHSGTGFITWQEQGGSTSAVKAAVNNTRIDCRACHEIHTTYSEDDFKLRTIDAVPMLIDSTKIYDAGSSNLCANCHQSRTPAPVPGGGVVAIPNTHYGPHHGPQATMLLSIGGYGLVDDPNPHATQVEGGCVTCHMADDKATQAGGHTFNASLAGCQSCHEGLNTFDRHGVQTETKALLNQLESLLTQQGVMHDGEPVAGKTFTEDQVGAYFNWLYITEDGSLGVHNSYYVQELLKKSISDIS
ncbi:MAG: hypothetical protein P3T54_09315 [Dehalogenimonas sp.]|jgi:hypothetical protein|uniref:Outer membrane cytochrome MtrC/MtrF-like domain-containing protein n=1 Tax=Candidatus Dehalogenimonas loeffleri TaxID=3127115 RepID=A0ABZ2J244_9CHLR|nr:hypothetical protein [Dehalogenimonas sp.]